MEPNSSCLTQRILDLSLEIIYLLTGEDNIVTPKVSEDGQNTFMVPLHFLLLPEKTNDTKILEVTQKIIELLVEEVPISCQDVPIRKCRTKDKLTEKPQTVMSPDGSSNRNPPERCPRPLESQESAQEYHIPPHDENVGINNIEIKEEIKEEVKDHHEDKWGYIEGHKDLYKDNAMMEDQPPLTSPDGSSNMDLPERCPRPLDSQETTLEDQIPPYDQNVGINNIAIKEEVQDHHEDKWGYLEEHKDLYKDIVTMNDLPPLTSLDGSSNRNPPERCPHPLDSQETTLEDHIPPYDQNGGINNIAIKEEVQDHHEDKWGYIEGHKDLYKDNVMIEDQPPLTSPDGSSNGNPPETGPQLLDFENSILEEHNYSSLVQLVVEVEKKPNKAINKKRKKAEKDNVMDDPEGHKDLYKDFVMMEVQVPLTSPVWRMGLNSSDAHSCLCPEENTEDDDMTCSSDLHLLRNKCFFSCMECGKIFKGNRAFTNHQRTHTNEQPFACPECGKCFKVKFCRDRHLKRHEKKELLSCEECGVSFDRKYDLLVHQRCHTGKEIFPCPECTKVFLRRYELSVHQRDHSGEKPYACSECSRSFKNRRDLVTHQRIHTGEKPYLCPECGKSFTHKSQLKTHEKVHTGEKPFTCVECGKSFPSKGNRDKHMRIHTGEKPFSCSDCGKRFAQKVTLLIHQRKHTS